MQLKLSAVAATVLVALSAQAEDYVSVQFLQYDESNNRTSVSAPSIEINKDFGTDYTLNASFVLDAVSGASETYYDSTSGASAFSRNKDVAISDIKYGNVPYEDTRAAGALAFTTRFDNRDELVVGTSYSSESDFYSLELSGEYKHWLTSSKNNSISLGASYQFNEILVRCEENSECDASSGASEQMDANALNLQMTYFQNINKSSYAKASVFYIADDGYLSNPYLNVVKNYNVTTATADVVAENRPDKRSAYGVKFDYVNALTTNTSMHLSYRFYDDDWDIMSHTFDSDVYYELGKDWIFKLGLRYYMQSEASFYSKEYLTNDPEYASSDFRLSDFNAITYKSNVDYKFTKDFIGNFGVNYYDQSTGLDAIYFIAGFRYNF